ncbi:MAG: hypothetical protein ACREB3_00765, partial [Burkholderiales bacterium]
VLGTANAASGWTTGVEAKVLSAGGTALVADNTAGGKIFSGRKGGFEKFGVSGTGDLTASGTGQFGGVVTGTRFSSTVASGTPPLAVNSTTLVPNLNADMIDGAHASAFAQLGANNAFSGTASFAGSNASQIVSVTQSGSGTGLSASSTTTGVYGSGGLYGVNGISGAVSGYGVYGYNASNIGVVGSGIWGVYGDSGSTASGRGVSGSSSAGTGYGVYGYNANNVGVQGYGINGVSGDSGAITGGIGVVGTSANATGIGMYGANTSNVGVWGYGYRGVYGTGGSISSGYGVYGYSSDANGFGTVGSNPNGVGVWGTGSTWGVYGSGSYGVYGWGSGAAATGVAGLGTSYGVFSFGTLGATGLKTAVVPLSDDRLVMVYAVESPEVWFEDFGSAQLQNGQARVNMEAEFLQTINTDITYHVFLTPNGDCLGLYVANKTPAGFEVRELSGGRSDVSFDYRIVARRKGYEDVRLQLVGADAETVQEIRRQTKVRNMPKIRMPKAQMPALPEPPQPAAARGPRGQ